MIILGLHKDPWHNTGAALIRDDGDGARFAYLAEERPNREKDSRKFPLLSTQLCMEELGVESLDSIDLIVMDYIEKNTNWRDDFFKRPTTTDNFLAQVDQSKIHMMNHHLAHAYSVFYSSPFERAAVLIVDGRGSQKETQSLFVASPEGMKLIASTDVIGIGLMYAAVTQAVGFKLLEEGKTMGLAPYGEHSSKRIFNFEHDFDGIVTGYTRFCEYGTYAIQAPHAPIVTFEDQARGAFEAQQECEEAMLHLARWTREVTGEDYLCLSGGVALNSVANYKILQTGYFKDIFINPAASDTGIPLGAALYGYHALMNQPKTYPTISPYLGRTYSDEHVERVIAANSGFEIIRENSLERAAELLADNQIVGHFYGRSEMGPRALGNRSILMSPLIAENKDILNARVKHREAFRPFAPVILEELAPEFYEIDRPSPYMLLVPMTRPDKQTIIPAVTHFDGTGRLQTIHRDFNPRLYAIVEAFYKRTDVPVILNTSFNLAGEPIIESPEDAMRCFLGTNIDALLIHDVLLIKTNQ